MCRRGSKFWLSWHPIFLPQNLHAQNFQKLWSHPVQEKVLRKIVLLEAKVSNLSNCKIRILPYTSCSGDFLRLLSQSQFIGKAIWIPFNSTQRKPNIILQNLKRCWCKFPEFLISFLRHPKSQSHCLKSKFYNFLCWAYIWPKRRKFVLKDAPVTGYFRKSRSVFLPSYFKSFQAKTYGPSSM